MHDRQVGFFEIGEDAAASGGVTFAGFGKLDRARRAMEQRAALMRFEEGDRPAPAALPSSSVPMKTFIASIRSMPARCFA